MSQDFKVLLQGIIEKLEPSHRPVGKRDIEAVLQAGADSITDLYAILRDRNVNTDVRSAICWILARVSDQRAVPALLGALGDESSKLRAAAARSLGELGGDANVQPLIAAMVEDEDAEVRLSGAYALGLLGNKQAVEPLVTRLRDANEDPRVRGAIAEALADLRDRRAVIPLIKALSDKSIEVRFWAAFALGELGDARALPELERMAGADDAVLPGHGALKEEAQAAVRRIKHFGSS